MLTCEELGKTPRVWLQVPGYVIRNYSPDLEDSVVQHMKQIFLKEEPVFRSCDFEDDPVAMKELDAFCRTILKQNLSLIAVPENDEGADLKPVTGVIPLAGVNMLVLGRRDDPPRPPVKESFSSAAMRKAFGTFREASKSLNFYDHFGVDEMIEAAGLGVHQLHRGRGLCSALLDARVHLCKALGVGACKTIFSSTQAQKIGLRCGYQTFHTVKFSDIKDDEGQLQFPHMPPDQCLIVTARAM